MKKLFIFLFMSMSMSLYAIDCWCWADINAEIRLNERKLSEENETILSELYLMREKSNVPDHIKIHSNDTVYIVEYVNLFERNLDFWKNKDYKQEYWSAHYKQEKGEKDIIVERNYIEWQYLCPCDQRRFDLCARMDVDGLHLESEKQKNSMISENPTAFTFLTQIIFESNGKSKITTIKFDGYEGMF